MTSISTGRVDITPTGMTEMGGYGTFTGPRLSIGTYSPLCARALAVWDPNPHVLVTLDAGTIPPAWHQALRTLLVSHIPTADVVIMCTHTHNAPMTMSHPDPWITYNATDLTACETYWDDLTDTVLQLVVDTLNAPQTVVTLDYRSVSQNWSALRASTGYIETAVPVLTARDTSGQPRAVLFGYGCHAVTAGVQNRWDGDYPAAACSAIESLVPGCHAQFVPGSGGDQDPIGTRGWRLRDALGGQLGSAVVTSLGTIGRPLVGPLTTSITSVTVPLRAPTTPAEWTVAKSKFQARRDNPVPYAPYPWYDRHAQRMIAQINAGTCETSITLPIQVWRLGSPVLRILFMSGEPVSGYGKWSRDHYGGVNNIMVAGYANEVPCYVVGDSQFPPFDTNGGYEPGVNTDFTPIIGGESMCVYGYGFHFRYQPDPQAAEGIILAALTAALA